MGSRPANLRWSCLRNGISKLDAPSLEEIARFLTSEGFTEIRGSYFGWWRAVDMVAIVDAKPDNFVRLPAGLIPRDLQMAIFTEMEATMAGLPRVSPAA